MSLVLTVVDLYTSRFVLNKITISFPRNHPNYGGENMEVLQRGVVYKYLLPRFAEEQMVVVRSIDHKTKPFRSADLEPMRRIILDKIVRTRANLRIRYMEFKHGAFVLRMYGAEVEPWVQLNLYYGYYNEIIYKAFNPDCPKREAINVLVYGDLLPMPESLRQLHAMHPEYRLKAWIMISAFPTYRGLHGYLFSVPRPVIRSLSQGDNVFILSERTQVLITNRLVVPNLSD